MFQFSGKIIYSVESNFITSLGETVNRYFQIYPSSSVVFAGDGSKSVDEVFRAISSQI